MAKILAFPIKISVNPIFTDAEKSAISQTIDIVQDLLELDGELINPETGEVISIDELPRVIGILDGILNSKEWTLH